MFFNVDALESKFTDHDLPAVLLTTRTGLSNKKQHVDGTMHM